MSKIIDRALDIINDRLKTQTSELSPTMEVRQGMPGMAHGGHVLEDDYPTHYLPHVGRQVMADGGMPAGRPDISRFVQQIQSQQAPAQQAPVVSDYAYTGAARAQGYEPNRPSWVAPSEYVQSFEGGYPTPYVYGYEPPKPAPEPVKAPQAAPSGGGGMDPLQMMFLMRAMGYAAGGAPDEDPVTRAVQTAQDVSGMEAPDMTPRPMMPSAPSAEGGINEISTSQVDIPTPKGVSYKTPNNAAASIIAKYKNTGLQFPDADSFGRLHKKLRRDQKSAQSEEVAGDPVNARTIVRAPKGLPDFVSGKLNYEDWVNRHNQILNDDEIHQAADWYGRIYNTFRQYYPGEDQAKKQMRAWLVGQQNVSPAGAQQNVLLQKEQIARGVPEHLWRAGGMPNPTEAIRAVLQDKPIAGGVGQKIADFVDAAEGKPVRSWMANHPDGGKPFVVDVHTARDTGMVDQELLNHLDRLGYNKEDLGKLKVDLTGTPTEAAYENRAAWGRGLTDHLNKMKWKGRDNWTPAEVQAVGWMGMTKLTRNAEEDVGSGLDRNMRRISYEIDPGAGSPWEEKYGDKFAELSPEEKAEITSKVADSAMSHASKLAGIDVHSLVHGTGAWEQYQNPAAVGQAQATHEGADIAANALGYLLNQTEVWHNRVKPMTTNPKGFAVDFIQKNGNDLASKEYLQDFWSKIMEADDTGLFKGFQPITLPGGEVGIRALIDKGGQKTKEKIENAVSEGSPIHGAIKDLGLDIDMMGHEAEITKARNDWTENKDGKGYMERLVDLVGSDRAASLAGIREGLEKELEGHFDAARKKRKTPQPDDSEKVAKAYGGAIAGPKLTEENAEDFARRLILWSYAAAPFVHRGVSRADGGQVDNPDDQALDVARSAVGGDPVEAAVSTARSLSPMGFYSAAAEAASKIPQRAPIDQILNKVKGSPNVKAEELDWSGVRDAFTGKGSVDPKEVARHFQENLPQLQETVKYDPVDLSNKLAAKRQSLIFNGRRDEAEAMKDEIEQSYNRSWRRENAARYKEYTLPDGENYREISINLPETESLSHPVPIEHQMGKGADINRVLHLRMSDRDWGKTLHIEEMQSDWGQEGRDEGFVEPGEKAGLDESESAEFKRLNSTPDSVRTPEENQRLDYFYEQLKRKQKGIPQGPHVTSNEGWTDLALKRALLEAAKGGYKKLIWTPGNEQAERYDLSNQVKHIMWSPDNKILSALTHDGSEAVGEKVEKEDLHKYIGKEAAKRLLDQEPEIAGNMATHHLRGQDISVGGEGMKNFYDRFVPNRLQKLVSKLDPDAKIQMNGHTIVVADKDDEDIDVHKKLHSLEITPKLRAAILKGLPAYEQGGAIVNKALDVVSGLRR